MNAFYIGFTTGLAARRMSPANVALQLIKLSSLSKHAGAFRAFPNPSLAAKNFYAGFMSKVRTQSGNQPPEIAKFAPIHRHMITQALARRRSGAGSAAQGPAV